MQIGARAQRCQKVGNRARSGTFWRPTLPWRLAMLGYSINVYLGSDCRAERDIGDRRMRRRAPRGERRAKAGSGLQTRSPALSLRLWIFPRIPCDAENGCSKFHRRSDKARIRTGTGFVFNTPCCATQRPSAACWVSRFWREGKMGAEEVKLSGNSPAASSVTDTLS